MPETAVLKEIYNKLLKSFGPQHWWPAKTPFEVVIGAILTQNTSWSNVEKAIANLRMADVLTPKKLFKCDIIDLALLIRPAGYFNIKAARLRSFIDWLFENYDGDLNRLFSKEIPSLREALLSVRGIGPETADSIILYAANKPNFVVDAYTYRITLRHRMIGEETGYDELKALFEDRLKTAEPEWSPDYIGNVKLFNEYHALLVKLGKNYCKKTKPLCPQCPLNDLPHD